MTHKMKNRPSKYEEIDVEMNQDVRNTLAGFGIVFILSLIAWGTLMALFAIGGGNVS